MEHHDNTIVARPVTQPARIPPRPQRSLAARIAAGFSTRLATLRDALEQAASRRELAELDDRMLADIGLSRGEALHEAARPFLDRTPRPGPWRHAPQAPPDADRPNAAREKTVHPSPALPQTARDDRGARPCPS